MLFNSLYLAKRDKKRQHDRLAEPSGSEIPREAPPDRTFEGWPVGKGREIEMVAEASSEALLDLCAGGREGARPW